MQGRLRVNSLLSQILSYRGHAERNTNSEGPRSSWELTKRGEISQITTTSQDYSGNEWRPSPTVTHRCWSVVEGRYRASPLFTKHPASVQRFPAIVLLYRLWNFPVPSFQLHDSPLKKNMPRAWMQRIPYLTKVELWAPVKFLFSSFYLIIMYVLLKKCIGEPSCSLILVMKNLCRRSDHCKTLT